MRPLARVKQQYLQRPSAGFWVEAITTGSDVQVLEAGGLKMGARNSSRSSGFVSPMELHRSSKTGRVLHLKALPQRRRERGG
jgi:hypothetical protein